MTAHNPPLQNAITEACQGLLFPSETDAEIIPIRWPQESMPALTPAALLAHEGLPLDTLVETVDFGTFFDRYAPGSGDPTDLPQQAALKNLQGLRTALLTSLSSPTVFRVGRIDIAIYVLGVTPEGTVSGIKTRAVET